MTQLTSDESLAMDVLSMPSDARRYALIALLVFILSEVVFSLLSFFTRGQSYTCIAFTNAIVAIFVRWMPPLFIVFQIEKRGLESLGLIIPPKKSVPYAIFAIAGIVLPVLLVGYDSHLPVEFLEQVVYIGLLEEFFYRGYLQRRFCDWLGDWKGLLLISFIFGLGHIISRIADHGFSAFQPGTIAGAQAFLGGLIFGYIYLKAKNIWPSAILHISSNMYFAGFIRILG